MTDIDAELTGQDITANFGAYDTVSGAASLITLDRLVSSVPGSIKQSRIQDGVTAGKVLTLAAADTFTLTVPATGTAALLSTANAFTAAQTIDLGTGALPAAVGAPWFRLAGADGVPARMEAFAFAASGINFRASCASGTRATPTATSDARAFMYFVARGYDGSAWGDAAYYGVLADGAWSGTNKGSYHQWYGVSNGSTTQVEWMRLQGGALGLGAAPTSGNGLLQLASGTTKANGWACGTDVFGYRNGAASFTIDATGGVTLTGGLGISGVFSASAAQASVYNIFTLRNTSDSASAFTQFLFGNDTAAYTGFFGVGSSAYAGLGGANSMNIGTAIAAPLALCTNSVVRVLISGTGSVSVASTADGALTVAGKISAKVAVPASFADLAAVRTYLASILA